MSRATFGDMGGKAPVGSKLANMTAVSSEARGLSVASAFHEDPAREKVDFLQA